MTAPVRRIVRGLPAVVINTRPDIDTEQVFLRLDGAVGLIQQYMPHHFRKLSRDFAGFLVERRAYRGAYLIAERLCMVELTFVVNPGFSLAQVAATILHEAMHARLHTLGLALDDSPRQERFCRRAEIEFGALVPGGEAVVQRARDALELADAEIAPVIDPALAARRVAEVDRWARGNA
ncbi:MAG: hypothetical protein ACM3OH_09275 [Bacillota bacterium]|jgi:hypothetical protein